MKQTNEERDKLKNLGARYIDWASSERLPAQHQQQKAADVIGRSNLNTPPSPKQAFLFDFHSLCKGGERRKVFTSAEEKLNIATSV